MSANGQLFVDRDRSIPVCIEPSLIEAKITPDPGYPLPHALSVARDLDESPGTFEEMVDKFFDTREAEQGCDFSYERALVQQRRVGEVNESIVGACDLLNRIRKPFPSRDRMHIEIGCGMGFGIAASAKSYFGPNVIGIDLSPHYLVMTKRLLLEHGVSSPRLICGDICDGWPINLEDHNIGFISMEGVLEHIKRIPEFFANLRKVKTFPLVVYLTVPYRWTVNPESHFNIRWIGFLPRGLQDWYARKRLGVNAIDHVELYSKRSLRRQIGQYIRKECIHIKRNSDDPLKAHYLQCLVYIDGPKDFGR